jgi:hypothetical protein
VSDLGLDIAGYLAVRPSHYREGTDNHADDQAPVGNAGKDDGLGRGLSVKVEIKLSP